MNRKLYIIALLALMFSCVGKEMDEVIFIPDPDDSNLPAYTEWGYNTYGARFGDEYFGASYSYNPFAIAYSNGHLNFVLDGYTSSFDEMKVAISFPCSSIDSYADLMALHEQTIDLAASNSIVKVDNSVVEVSSGSLTFKRAQLLRIDMEPERVILSGTFEVFYRQGGVSRELTDGRFDLGVTSVD
jgi:hypothetical protein